MNNERFHILMNNRGRLGYFLRPGLARFEGWFLIYYINIITINGVSYFIISLMSYASIYVYVCTVMWLNSISGFELIYSAMPVLFKAWF